MEINQVDYPNCDLVKVSGRIDSYTAPLLSSRLNSVIDNGKFNIILDMTEAVYVSSAGLRVLIDIQKSCRQNKRGEMVLLNLPKRVFETLELAGFLPLYKLFDDRDRAVSYFSK